MRFAVLHAFCAVPVCRSIAHSAFALAVALLIRPKGNYTSFAFYSTFIGKGGVGGIFPSSAIGQKMA
jgi:hypothetical protein